MNTTTLASDSTLCLNCSVVIKKGGLAMTDGQNHWWHVRCVPTKG